MWRRPDSLGLLLLLSACGGSPPSHFYTLAPVAPERTSQAPSGLIVVVAPVTLPPALDRDAVVTSTGPNQLNVSGENRWAAPLSEIVRRVLADDLARRMPGAVVPAPGDPVPTGHVRTVDVNVRQFIGDSGGRVMLDADWTVHGSGKIHSVSLTGQAGSGKATAVVATMDKLLAELSDRIAAGIDQ